MINLLQEATVALNDNNKQPNFKDVAFIDCTFYKCNLKHAIFRSASNCFFA